MKGANQFSGSLLFFLIAFQAIFFLGCSSPKGQETPQGVPLDEATPSKQERAQILNDDLKKIIPWEEVHVELNNGQKWELDSSVFYPLNEIYQKIYVLGGNFDSFEIDQLNQEAVEIHELLSQIQINEALQGEAELGKVIVVLREQILVMMGANKKNAQIAMLNMGNLMEGVKNSFTLKAN